jgi:hypothetical protein
VALALRDSLAENAMVGCSIADLLNDTDTLQIAALAAIQAIDGECQRLRSALEKAREAIANLPQDGLGMAQIAFGGPDDIYPIRDELLSEIDAALKEQSA